jgi:hypothetical protein
LASVEIDLWELPSILEDECFRSEFPIDFNFGGRLVSDTKFVLIVGPGYFNARRQSSLAAFTKWLFIPVGNFRD